MIVKSGHKPRIRSGVIWRHFDKKIVVEKFCFRLFTAKIFVEMDHILEVEVFFVPGHNAGTSFHGQSPV